MRSLLNQLESDQAILLMYIADELSAADRAEVERRLSADDGLRTELQALRDAQAAIGQSLESLDRLQPATGAAASSQRRACRMIRQWQIDRLLAKSMAPAMPRARSHLVWAYQLAAVIVLFVGFVVWWGLQPDDGRLANGPIIQQLDSPPPAPAENATTATVDQSSDGSIVTAPIDPDALSGEVPPFGDSLLRLQPLAEAEAELEALEYLSTYTQ